MTKIPLEDNFTDILGKAQRGLKLSDERLAAEAGVSVEALTRLKGGEADEAGLRKLAPSLRLAVEALVISARKAWYPQQHKLPGFAQFNTPFEDMTVNAYLAWDRATEEAVAFDTGASCADVLDFVESYQLKIKLILLTHTHPDHIADLAKLKEVTGAPAFVCQDEAIKSAQSFAPGRSFQVGRLKIESRRTSGHSAGGITYVIAGLAKPVAVVGDALFAGSMGGGGVSWSDALSNNRKQIFTLSDDTILCPGHGPLTSVGEEKLHNPFYPEFQNTNTQQHKKSMAEKIGVVGVGRMGANMARRLKDVGYTVAAVYDARPEAAQALAQELGCEACVTLARVTALSDVVLTVVTDDKAVRHIFRPAKEGDSLLTKAAGKVFVNCATISPKVHVEVEKAANRAKAESLEACMASSITQAREGTLYLMCGGKESAYNRVKPLLEKLSSSMRYVGKAGQAANVKALVNMVMNSNTAALAEGLGLGHALKLDLAMLREVFSQTGANARVLQTDGEDMQNREHSCFFSASHAAKDSGIALGIAKEQGLDLPVAAATLKQYQRMVKLGLGELDKSGVAELTFKGRLKKKK